MLLRRSTAAGLVVFESSLLAALGLSHAFSTRAAGLDLAAGPLTPIAPPDHPYHRLLWAIGAADAQTIWSRQVHGRSVVAITPGNAHAHPQADGMVTLHPNLALTIRIADCVPVLLAAHAAGRPRAVAAIHAGWRGLVAGILPAAMDAIRNELGDDRFALAAAIGPCIGRERFEVGPEVAQAFHDAGLGAVVMQDATGNGNTSGGASRAFSVQSSCSCTDNCLAPASSRGLQAEPSNSKCSREGKAHIDLQAAAVRQLRDAGLADADIDRSDLCTHRDQADFYSHRRDKGITGRLAAAIVMRG